MYMSKGFSNAKRAASLFTVFCMLMLSFPVIPVTAQVTSDVYTVEENAVKNVYPETLICDFLDRMAFDGEKKLLRDGLEIETGYIEEGDILAAGGDEYVISLRNSVLYNPAETLENVADNTVIYEKPLNSEAESAPLKDYGFPYIACEGKADYNGKTLKVTKGSTDGVPYYEVSTDCATPHYFYGTRMSTYVNSETTGKYIVFEATILPITNGMYGFSNYIVGSSGGKPIHTYFSKTVNSSFLMGKNGNYGIGGYVKSTNPTTSYGAYTLNNPMTYKMYFKITPTGATQLELSELLINGESKGDMTFSVNEGTSINYFYSTLMGIASDGNGEAKARFSNVRTYIADTYPSVGSEASITLKAGADYTISQTAVSEIPSGTTASQLLSSLEASEKAVIKVLDSSGAEAADEAQLDSSMKLKVISGNGKNEKLYALDIAAAVPQINAVIEGEAETGKTLQASFTAQNNDYKNCSVTYRWLISDSKDGDYEPIGGETDSTLYIDDVWYGKYIRVEITPYLNSEAMLADTSAAAGPVADKKMDFKESINTASAATIEERISEGAEKFPQIGEIKAQLDEYKFRLASLNILKGIPYSGFDDVVSAFSSAADSVTAAFEDDSVITLEGVTANEGTILSTHIDHTPDANIFTYGGKEFIVIDSNENEMYVMTKDYCGRKAANTNKVGIYDALDEASIAYFLNRSFVTEGNGGYILPPGIVSYINYDKIWVSEPQSGTTATKTVGGIGLLSVTEYREYASRIGDDTIPEGAVMYYLRSPSCEYAYYMLGLSLRELNGVSTRGSFIASRTESARELRPVFYLDKSFFEKNKLESVGSDVALRIASICSEEKLRELYTTAEMNTFFKKPVITSASVSGRPIVGNTLTADYVFESDFKESGTQYQWLSSSLQGSGYSPITGKTEKTLFLDDSLAGKFIKVEITPVSELAINSEGAIFTTEPTACAVMTQAAADSAAAELNSVPSEQIHQYLTENDDVFMTIVMESDPDIRNLAIGYLAQSEFTTMTEFEQDMNTCITMAKIRAGAETEVEEIITTNQSSINMTNYTELEDKSSVNSYIKATTFTSAEDFIKKVDEKVGVTYFNNATRDDIDSVLLRLDDMITKDISALSDTQLTTLGLGVLTVDSYSDMAAVNAKINELYPTSSDTTTDVNPPVSGSDNSSGGGGGGGGGGGAGSSAGITAPSTNQSQNNAAASPFSDMKGYEWANTAVNKLVGKGIINGMGDGRFAPADTLTREQFIKMIVTAFNLKASGKNNPFSDVADGHWSADYILAAYENGITTGINETQFGVGTALSKEQMVTFIYRALEKAGVNIKTQSPAVLKDKEAVSVYAADAVAKLSSAGIVSGDENGYFNPSQTATRAMAAVVIYKTLENAEVSK